MSVVLRATGWIVSAAVLLAGCALAQPRDQAAVPFAPLSPASLGRTVQAEQILRIAYGESGLALQCTASVTPAETSLTCFTALGQRAFHLKHDGQTLSSEAAALNATAISPERILTDLQLAYWPLPALTAAMAGSLWQVSEPVPDVRRLRHNGALYADIYYSGHLASAKSWDGRLWLVNFEQRYSLDIESRAIN